MSWLVALTFLTAFGSLLCGVANCLYFGRYARRSGSRPRTAGALALSLVNAGFALEASLFIALAHPESMTALGLAAVAGVRLLLFAAAAFISILILRAPRRDREG